MVPDNRSAFARLPGYLRGDLRKCAPGQIIYVPKGGMAAPVNPEAVARLVDLLLADASRCPTRAAAIRETARTLDLTPRHVRGILARLDPDAAEML